MDVLTFVSQVVKSLAWPVAIAVLAVVFRNQLKELLDRLIELKVYRVSLRMEATKALKERRLELQLPQVEFSQLQERRFTPAPNTKASLIHDPQEPPRLSAAEAPHTVPLDVAPHADPRVELEISWRGLQADLLKKAHRFGGTRLKKAESAASYLADKNAVPPEFQAAFAQVLVVHDEARLHPNSSIDADLAGEFKRTCDKLREYLAQIES